MKLFGPLENASIESLSTLPTTAVAGRFYINANTNNVEVDDGTTKRALLRNDGRAVIGTDTTASNNVRLHHAGQGLLQFVTGQDTTAENVASTNLAMLGLRVSNLAADPAAGNIGRIYYNTATNGLKVEASAGFLQFATLTGQETLTNKTLSQSAFDVLSGQDQSSTPQTPASGTKIYTKAGSLYKISTDGVESIVGAGGNTTNFVTKSASYTAASTDGVAFISASGGAVTVTLPSASANGGVRLSFNKTDASANAITLSGAGVVMSSQDEVVVLLSNGTAWFVLDRMVPHWTATYYFTSSTSSASGQPVKYATKEYDPGNIFSPTTGLLTVPKTGLMKVSMIQQVNTQSNLYLRRAAPSAADRALMCNATVNVVAGVRTIPVVANETYGIYPDATTTFTGLASGPISSITFERAGY